MALLLKDGSIFLHIPKTGGSWISKVLEEQYIVKRKISHIHSDLDHLMDYVQPASSILEILTGQIKPYLKVGVKRVINKHAISKVGIEGRFPFVFCFVRHPYTWYESYWSYMTDEGWPLLGDTKSVRKWHPCSELNDLRHLRFSEFISAIIDLRPGFLSNLYARYIDSRIAFVGKQENLIEDVLRVIHFLGMEVDANKIRRYGKVNASSGKSLYEWPRFGKKEIYRLEFPVFRKYNYPGN